MAMDLSAMAAGQKKGASSAELAPLFNRLPHLSINMGDDFKKAGSGASDTAPMSVA